jgi:hypothetical protein
VTTVAAVLFWAAVGLLVYTHAGYPLLLAVLVRLRPKRGRHSSRIAGEKATAPPGAGLDPSPPSVSLIVPAYD